MTDQKDRSGQRRRKRDAGIFWRFLRSEEAGGALLIAASLTAFAWSNSAGAPAYARLLDWPVGAGQVALPLHSLVNEGLMALFFLLASLEIRREMTIGSLATLRGAAAPAIAALGGMAVPALIYLALNHADPATARGWAVPVATDIAFSLAVLRVLGRHASSSLRVFLTALAILDDLGAIVVIALFYTAHLSAPALGGAALVWLSMFVLNRAGWRALWPYLAGGAALWVLLLRSGVHPTLAGVALALVVPARGERSAAARLEDGLVNLVSFVILPVFGLINAGLDLRIVHLSVLANPAPLGVLLGLFVGKQVGVFGATLLGRRLGVLTLPPQMGAAELYGAALLCGIGFTISLFIGDLAFRGTPLLDGVKLAVFCGSLLSAAAGSAVLLSASHRERR